MGREAGQDPSGSPLFERVFFKSDDEAEEFARIELRLVEIKHLVWLHPSPPDSQPSGEKCHPSICFTGKVGEDRADAASMPDLSRQVGDLKTGSERELVFTRRHRVPLAHQKAGRLAARFAQHRR